VNAIRFALFWTKIILLCSDNYYNHILKIIKIMRERERKREREKEREREREKEKERKRERERDFECVIKYLRCPG